MKFMSLEYIGNIVLNSFIFFLLLAVYSYIEKIENNGCVCADHPNKDFIKKFSIIIMVFLAVVIFIPTSLVMKKLGSVVAGIYTFVKFVFYILCIVYFYITIDYIRFLVNEKCKCSEDIRRELIMGGSIIEITLFLLVLFTIIILPLLFNSFLTISNNLNKYNDEFSTIVKNPIKTVKSIPSKLKSTSKSLSNVIKKSKK